MHRPVYPEDIAAEIGQPNLLNLIQKFIYNQQHSNDVSDPGVPVLPIFYGKITVSDISGVGGMHCEWVCAIKSWRRGPGCYDTIFVSTDPIVEGLQGLEVA